MRYLRNVLAMCLILCMALGMTAAVFAWNSSTEAVELGIEKAAALGRGTVEVELRDDQAVTAKDWELLQGAKKPFQLTYRDLSYRFSNTGMALGYEQICLSDAAIPTALVDAICETTGLEEDEFMLVLPNMIGTLPSTATIGVALSPDFVENNGNQNVNIYGIDFGLRAESVELETEEDQQDYADYNGELRTETDDEGEETLWYDYNTYFVRSIGLAATRSGEKSYSSWLTFQSGTSRMLLLTTRTIETKGSMSWGSTTDSMASTDRVLSGEEKVQTATTSSAVRDDSNPNTGVQPIHGMLLVGIVLLGSASVFTLVRSIRKRW